MNVDLNKKVRVRFAPSPTGPLHIGGLRIALCNFLFTKKRFGKFILRIEDTDINRYNDLSENHIVKSLNWCKLLPDESPIIGGKYGPYKQSERLNIYKNYINILVNNLSAYYAYDTKSELSYIKKYFKKRNKEFVYNCSNRYIMNNSLTNNIKLYKFVIRFKVPCINNICVYDCIYNNIRFNIYNIEDKIILRSNGIPTYHICNVIDDHFMKISHVIRGEDWLSSLPIHILIYYSFNWIPPKYIHIPLILSNSNNGKISKRNINNLNNLILPIKWEDNNGNIILGYKESGILSVSLLNMLFLLGYKNKNNNEIFSLNDMINKFSIYNINLSSSKINFNKIIWINSIHIKKKSNLYIINIFKNKIYSLINEDNNLYNKIYSVINLIKMKSNTLNDIWDNIKYLCVSPNKYYINNNYIKITKNHILFLEKIKNKINNIKFISSIEIKKKMSIIINELKLKYNYIMMLFRILLVGKLFGLELYIIMYVIGKFETISRINNFIKYFNNM